MFENRANGATSTNTDFTENAGASPKPSGLESFTPPIRTEQVQGFTTNFLMWNAVPVYFGTRLLATVVATGLIHNGIIAIIRTIAANTHNTIFRNFLKPPLFLLSLIALSCLCKTEMWV